MIDDVIWAHLTAVIIVWGSWRRALWFETMTWWAGGVRNIRVVRKKGIQELKERLDSEWISNELQTLGM